MFSGRTRKPRRDRRRAPGPRTPWPAKITEKSDAYGARCPKSPTSTHVGGLSPWRIAAHVDVGGPSPSRIAAHVDVGGLSRSRIAHLHRRRRPFAIADRPLPSTSAALRDRKSPLTLTSAALRHGGSPLTSTSAGTCRCERRPTSGSVAFPQGDRRPAETAAEGFDGNGLPRRQTAQNGGLRSPCPSSREQADAPS